MQSLYTFKSKKDQSILNGEKDMLKHIEDISKLQIVVISFLLFLFRHAQNFFEENKSKFLPKDEDINPNLRFIDNSFYKFFLKNKTHISMYEKYSFFWNDNDHDIIRKIFMEIIKSDLYIKFLNDKKLVMKRI